MGELSPLTVVIPLLAAAGLVGAVAISTRLFLDIVSILVAAGVTVLCLLLLRDADNGLVVEWLGGWQPRDGVAIGVGLAVDPIGAGLASFVGLMFVMAFVFSYRYFAVVGPLFHTLMLVFLAGATGFCLTGDLFTMFVFFELVSVSAYALTAYDIEEEGPLTGTLSFAVTNSVGAFLILTGIALLYARTGALNMAQIGDALASGPADALVIGAFTMITVGFLTKAAVVPFHFWLADAYSVAPTPVCLLLSAAMSELGLYALARVYWTVFSGVLDDVASAVTAVLLVAGALTALLGAVMCFAQRHLKRMLAFATISHVGLFLIGIALLEPGGLGRHGDLRDGRRRGQSGAVRGRRGDPAPVRIGQRAGAAAPLPRPADHGGARDRGRPGDRVVAAVRAVPREGDDRGGGKCGRIRVGGRRVRARVGADRSRGAALRRPDLLRVGSARRAVRRHLPA